MFITNDHEKFNAAKAAQAEAARLKALPADQQDPATIEAAEAEELGTHIAAAMSGQRVQ